MARRLSCHWAAGADRGVDDGKVGGGGEGEAAGGREAHLEPREDHARRSLGGRHGPRVLLVMLEMAEHGLDVYRDVWHWRYWLSPNGF